MKEIVVVTPARVGLVADIAEILGERGINLDTIEADTVQGTMIVTMTLENYDEALKALRDGGFDALTEDALLIQLRDEPGALAKVAKRFKDANITLRSLRFIRRENGQAFVALSTEQPEEAKELAKEYLVGE